MIEIGIKFLNGMLVLFFWIKVGFLMLYFGDYFILFLFVEGWFYCYLVFILRLCDFSFRFGWSRLKLRESFIRLNKKGNLLKGYWYFKEFRFSWILG